MKKSFLAIAAIATLLPAQAAETNLTRAEPVVCDGNQTVTLRGSLIETEGNGIVARGNCRVQIVDCRIVAGGIAVLAEGNGNVDVEGSQIEGGRGGLVADGNARIAHARTTIAGGVRGSAFARIVDRGGSSATDAAAAEPASVSIGGGTIEVGGPGGVTIDTGGGGVVVHDAARASTVSTGPGGVTIDTPEARVVVAGDYVQVDAPAGVTTVSGDWRGVSTVHSGRTAADVMTELGAVDVDGEIRIDLAGDVLFDSGSAALQAAAEARLGLLAQLLRTRVASKVYVIGHTDSHGDDARNQKLSERRAVAVMRWLAERERIPAAIMFGQGMGERSPVASNARPDGTDDPAGRARNRRVEVRFAAR